MLNTEKFEQALYSDGKLAFRKILETHGNDLYVIGLYHFGGFDGVMPMFNTFSALKTVQESYIEQDAYYANYTAKWNPSDYPSLEEYSEYFEQSTAEIQKLRGSFEDSLNKSSSDLQDHWQQTLRAMERVLIRLDNEGIFSTGLNREQVTLSISTYDESEQEQFDRIKRLNPDNVLKKIEADFEMMIATRAKWEQEAMESLD